MIRVAKLFLDLQQTFVHTHVIFFFVNNMCCLSTFIFGVIGRVPLILHEKLARLGVEPSVIVATSINSKLVGGKFGC